MPKKAIELFLKLRYFPASLYLAADNNAAGPGIFNKLFSDIGKEFNAAPASPGGAQNVGQLVLGVVEILLLVAGSAAVIFLVVGGYRYIAAHGNEEQSEAAKKTITSAIIGLAVIVLSFAIVTMISNILLKAPSTGTGI
jgi:hypothetical protein